MSDVVQPFPEWCDRGRMVRFILAGGLALTLLLGIGVREWLRVKGVSVVPIGRGAGLLIPFAVWAEIPFAVLALIVRRVLAKPGGGRCWMAVGGFLGLAVAQSIQLIDAMSYHGPGGFAEVAGMMMTLSLITIPVMVVLGMFGAGVGATLGWLLWRAFGSRSARGP
ncbi:MAG: hypothetical protein HUJ24_08820 [Rhodobacteraceae bacterium]|nr:hypothetical protein [Paracoccaceae bacterium]